MYNTAMLYICILAVMIQILNQEVELKSAEFVSWWKPRFTLLVVYQKMIVHSNAIFLLLIPESHNMLTYNIHIIII